MGEKPVPSGVAGGPSDDAGRELDRRGHYTVLLLAFLAAFGIRAALAWASGAAAPQEVRYIDIAEGLLDGSAFEKTGTRFPAIIQPPFYPFLIVLARSVIGEPLAAARGASALLGALLVFPAASLTRRILGGQAARRAAWIAATYPLLSHISGLSMTESTFGLLVATAAVLFHRAGEDEGVVVSLLAGGGLLGLAFLTRPEGLAYALGGSSLVFLYLWRSHKRGFLRAAGCAMIPILGFLLFAGPYAVWIHGKTGRWLVAPKAILTQAHNSIMTEGAREGWPEKYGTRTFYERVKFGLNRDGTDLRSAEVFRTMGLLPGEGPRPAPERAISDLVQPGHLARVVARNLGHLYLETIKYGLVIPTLLMIFAAIGVTSQPWRQGPQRRGQIMMVWWLLAGGSSVLSYVQPRFLYSSIVFVIPWMAEGWRRVEAWAWESFGSPPGILGKGWTALLTVAVAVSLVHVMPPTRETASTWAEHRQAGLALKELGTGDGRVMALTDVVSFYAGMPFEMLPYADLDDLLRYARLRAVRYIVADMVEYPSFRPQLSTLLDPNAPHPGLRPALIVDDHPGNRLVIYELLPEGGGIHSDTRGGSEPLAAENPAGEAPTSLPGEDD